MQLVFFFSLYLVSHLDNIYTIIFRYFLSLSEPFFREEIQSRHLKFEKLIKYIQLIKSQIKMFKQQKDVLGKYTFSTFSTFP